MSTLAIQILALALVVVQLRAPFKVSAAVLLVATFVVPGALLVPDAPAYVFVLRVGLWSACAGIVVRAATGEIDRLHLRPSRALVAFALFVAVAYVIGVAGAPFPSQSERAFELWLLLFDQLLFLWAATVAVRVLGVRFVASCAAVGVVAVAVVAVLERVTGGSYAHWWFRHQTKFGLAGQRLETRGGTVRVRATGEYALQFAWVLAFFVPLVGVLALRAKRLWMLAGPCVVMLAIVLTVTRSVFAGVAAGGVCLLLCARGDRRVIGGVLAVAAVAGVVYLSSGAVRHPYQAADPESESVRARRLSTLTNELTRHSWTGLGLDGAARRGIDSTDSSLLGVYAGAGVVGVTALVGALATATFTVVAAASLGKRRDGPLAGALLGGLAAGTLAMFAFDSLSGPLPGWNLWLFAALGVGLYEEVMAARDEPLRPRPVRLSPRRLMLPVFGLGIGAVVAVATPSHVAVQLSVFTLRPDYLARTGNAHADFVGRVLVQTTCDAARAAIAGAPVRFECFDPLQSGLGTGIVRIEARHTSDLRAARATFVAVAARVHAATRVAVSMPATEGRPTWARTAPATAALLFGELALLLPGIRLRERRRTTPQLRAPASLSPAYP